MTLDEIAQRQQYAMGKLDVEGAEGLVLAGAERLLRAASPPVWELELVERFVSRFGWSVRQLVHHLAERGFDIATYDADSNRLTFSQDIAGTQTNVLAVAREARDEVLARLQT